MARPPWLRVLVALILGVGLALAALRLVASPLVVTGSSMWPTLDDGSVCLVVWTAGARSAAGPGSIVFARLDSDPPGRHVIKRVTRADGAPGSRRLVLRGDNARVSRDSRSFGPLPESALLGVVVARIAPRPAYWGVDGPAAPPSTEGRRDDLRPAGR